MEISLLWSMVLVVSLAYNVVSTILIKRALIKQDIYDLNIDTYAELITNMSAKAKWCLDTMRQVDIRGSFESDDEVGGVFIELHHIVNELEPYATTELIPDNR